jgi:cytochrome c oxidase subunit 2
MRARTAVAAVALIAASGVLGYGVAAWAESPAPKQARLIKVSAKKFEFTPRNLTLKKGETVDIELGSEDVVMGFNVPEMTTRATIVPGQAVHVLLTPQKTGSFTFLCDVFCGSGHEDMDGTITVVE